MARGSARVALHLLILTVLLARLPLLGAAWIGLPLTAFEEPLARPGFVHHAPFSWPLFALGCAIAFAFLLPPSLRFFRARPSRPPRTSSFPAWGLFGIALIALAWPVAWGVVPVSPELRAHTFTPLWVGYIVVVNALTEQRKGTCLLRSRAIVPLTLVSAVFWWFFEYLNRFVESWDYTGARFDGPFDVVLHGVLPFATVLPAVASTQALFATFPRLTEPFAAWQPISLRHTRARAVRNGPIRTRCQRPERSEVRGGTRVLGAVAIACACAGLILLPIAPNFTFPLPWLAPLFVLVGLDALEGRRPVLSEVAHGDYRRVVTWAAAALTTGFFWEMWNAYSLAKWTYTIPFVGRFHLFEMPILGYLGYLPFGLECAAVAALLGYPKSAGQVRSAVPPG